METCPVPHVSDALKPFIKPRNEVTKIRQALQAYLERQLSLEGQPLSVANASNPPLSCPLQEPPSALTGVRRAYWRALRSHQRAQARYDTLKEELSQVSKESFSNHEPQPQPSGADYLPLLRQRERRRKLIVLERAVSGIETEGSGLVGAGVDDLVRARVGEVPVPPSQNGFSSISDGKKAEVDERLVQLKKAVLSAKRVVDEQERGDGANGTSNGSREDDGNKTYALQQARNGLISWIEKQLALIGESQGGEDAELETGDDSMVGEGVSNEEIAQLYEGYIRARRQILQTLESPPTASPRSLSPSPERQRSASASKENQASRSLAMAVLPYAQSLLSIKNEEQAQLQQSAYARRQLAAAETETNRILRRLADESHLVHPGASRGHDWAAAANESSQATKQFAEGKITTGKAAADEAEAALESIGNIISNLEKLVAVSGKRGLNTKPLDL